MKIYLCDDQKEHLKQVADMFAAISKEYPMEIEAFTSAGKLLEQLENGGTKLPELVFLDIEMPEINGISLGKRLKEQYPNIYLVFLTAYSEYAIKGYEANAFRYLLKPVTKENLRNVLAEFEEEESKKKKIVIKTQNGQRILAVRDIIYMSAEDKYTIIYAQNESFVSDLSLNAYEEQLGDVGFFRIHRKHLVNLYHHKAIEGNHIILSPGNTLPISVRKLTAYRNRLFSCMKENLL